MSVLPRSGAALTVATFDAALEASRQTCDLGKATFVDAYGLVATACAIRAAQPPVAFVGPQAVASARHLSVMGLSAFLAAHNISADLPDGSAADTPDVVVPLRSTIDSSGAQDLSNLLWHQLRDEVAPEVLEALTEGVWEMVGNALEHSGDSAVIMGQVYRRPKGQAPDHDDQVQVVVGDTGRGIRDAFLASGRFSPETDAEAIDLALTYLVSSVDDPGRGQGLSTTVDQILPLRGTVVVRSGTCKMSITKNNKVPLAVPPLPGVIVALSLPLYP